MDGYLDIHLPRLAASSADLNFTTTIPASLFHGFRTVGDAMDCCIVEIQHSVPIRNFFAVLLTQRPHASIKPVAHTSTCWAFWCNTHTRHRPTSFLIWKFFFHSHWSNTSMHECVILSWAAYPLFCFLIPTVVFFAAWKANMALLCVQQLFETLACSSKLCGDIPKCIHFGIIHYGWLQVCLVFSHKKVPRDCWCRLAIF